MTDVILHIWICNRFSKD